MIINMHTEKLDTNARIFLEAEAWNIAVMKSVPEVKPNHKAKRTANSEGAIVGYLYAMLHRGELNDKNVEWLTEYFSETLPNEMEMKRSFEIRAWLEKKGAKTA